MSGRSYLVAQDRRRALALLGVAGVAVAGCSRAAEQEEDGHEVTANEDLMREHGVLRRILIVYRELAPRVATDAPGIDAGAIAAAASLFRRFGERYHERLLEEQHIFPAVRKAGGDAAGLVDTLLAQHARGREITDYLIDRTREGRIGDGPALAGAMAAFARMYEAHTAREDTIVFPAFKQSLGDKAYRELGERFEEIEHREFGGDGFDIALREVGKIEGRTGLADLAMFTASKP